MTEIADDTAPTGAAVDQAAARDAAVRTFHRHVEMHGEIRFPAIPGMLDECVKACESVFTVAGVRLTTLQRAHLTMSLRWKLSIAYASSRFSEISVAYRIPKDVSSADYQVKVHKQTSEEFYSQWATAQDAPLFGRHPDARVWDLAVESGNPARCPVLDIGAGTGRNTLPLAKRGHPVDAMEPVPVFADQLRRHTCPLDIRVLQQSVFDDESRLLDNYTLIVASEVVSEFDDPELIEEMLGVASRHLSPSGKFVFNAHLPVEGYVPDDTAMQLGRHCMSTIFTWEQLNAAADRAGLVLISDLAVCDYEKSRLPRKQWPPTPWYESWSSGTDVFNTSPGESPVQMRWLVYQKKP